MKKKILGLFICMLLIISMFSVSGQVLKTSDKELIKSSNAVTWSKTFGGEEADSGSSVQQTDDGGYIAVGTTKSYGPGMDDIWLIKTDNKGELLWQEIYGGELDDYGYSVQQTSDGGYIITGNTQSFADNGRDIWLIKTNSNGDSLWNKTFDYLQYDSGTEVRETNDGGFIIVGCCDDDTGPFKTGLLLIKTDYAGNFMWDQNYGNSSQMLRHGRSVKQTEDGGYIISSSIYDPSEDLDIRLIKTDNTGELIWEKKFDGYYNDVGNSVQQTNDNGYIICGTSGYGISNKKVWLIKTDSSGELLWEKMFTEKFEIGGFSVQQTDDGGYIIAGILYKEVGNDALLLKTNINGGEEWRKYYGKIGNDAFLSVQQTDAGGYILTGYKDKTIINSLFNMVKHKTDEGSHDLWLVKTDSNGNVKLSYNRNLFREILFKFFPTLIYY